VGEGFVGRADELAAIAELLAACPREKRVGALLLVGEPGIGKSRLLDEAERAEAGRTIVRLAGYEPEAGVPLAAAAPLLRRLAAASEDRTFLGLLDPGAEVGGLDAIRIFESVHRGLARLQPSALFVDDLQWVDPVSVAMCHYLIRAVDGSGRGLALVVASRPSPVVAGFAESLRGAIGDGVGTRMLPLGPLDRAAAIRLVESRGDGIERREAIDLWERAGGSPFWLDVLIQARGHEGDVSEVVAARIRGLGRDASALLTMLAILGRPGDASELEDLVAWPTERTVAAVGELVQRGLGIDDAGGIRLAHDLIREVVVNRTPESTARRLHGRIATVLEERAAGDVGGLLSVLEHRAAAGSFDADLALRILGSSQRRLIGSDGVRRIADSARGLDDIDARASVDRAAAALAAELGDQLLASDRWSAVERETSDPQVAAHAGYGAALAAYHLGRRDDARRWLEKSRARDVPGVALEIASDALEARILLWLEHRTDDGGSIAMRGVERGRRAIAEPDATSDVRAAHLGALVAAWEAAIQGEHVDLVLSLADEHLEASKAMGLREQIEARAMIGMALEYAADQRDAVTVYREVLEDAWRAVLPVEAVDVGYRLAAVLVDILDLDEARRISAETERLAARAGDQGRVRDRTRIVTYLLQMMTSDWSAAVDAVLAAGTEEPDPHYGLRYPLAAAVWLARLGARADEALQHAHEALDLAAAAGCIACARDTDVEVVEVFARFDALGDADSALARWDAVGRPSWLESEWQRKRAGLLVAAAKGSGDIDLAAALTDLRDDAHRQGLLLDALLTELDMGRLLSGSDRHAAAAAFRAAAERADVAGATTMRKLADQGLRTLGERPWKRGRAAGADDGLAALSDREREVADLVASGATNPEIAARLFLSRKTVEHHVSNALAKLGLHSRTELAAIVGRHGPRSDGQDGAPPP
jgi:DNA-binding CsgD family transcriptional regulator